MSQVEIQAVHKVFPGNIRALDGVHLEIDSGEIVAILGQSGSGKTTLLRCINGLETPTSGDVRVEGSRVEKSTLRPVRRKVGMIFQKVHLVPRLSVMENVMIGRLGYHSWAANLFGRFAKLDYELAENALAEVGLLDRAWDRADKLSGGQQQRVGIARTIVQQPSVILADEPVASLDPKISRDVMSLLTRVVTNRKVTLIVNLHQVDIATAFAHRIVGLASGKVSFDLPTNKVSKDHLGGIYGETPDAIENGVAALV